MMIPPGLRMWADETGEPTMITTWYGSGLTLTRNSRHGVVTPDRFLTTLGAGEWCSSSSWGWGRTVSQDAEMMF